MKIKHLFVSILLATGFQPMIAQSALRQQFVNSPVQEARPWTFWYWMFGAVKRIVLSSVGIRLPAIWIQTDVLSS